VEIVVGGASMWPLLRHGDRVRIEPERSVSVGSLAAVWRAGHLVVHRVVAVEGDVVRLRGDHLDREDAPCTRAEILGVVTRQWTKGLPPIDHANRIAAMADRIVAQVRTRTDLPWRVAARIREVRDQLRSRSS